ncbi:MAG: hypothetical protein AAGA59_02055 [Actinomycetota bacterium]
MDSLKTDPVDWLVSQAQPGDLLLSGAGGLAGNLIQMATGSDYSHTMLVVDDRTVVEAYEYGLTPNERDEGVYRTPFHQILERAENLQVITLRRPLGLDPQRFLGAVERYESLNPTFASIGVCLIGLWRTANSAVDPVRLASGLSPEGLLEILKFQGLLTGDGPARVHCSELATRIYAESGLSLRFTAPTLAPLLASLASGAEQHGPTTLHLSGDVWVADANDGTGRQSTPTDWRGWRDLADVARSLRERFKEAAPPDFADFIVPGDFRHAAPFDDVGTLRHHTGGWRRDEVP